MWHQAAMWHATVSQSPFAVVRIGLGYVDVTVYMLLIALSGCVFHSGRGVTQTIQMNMQCTPRCSFEMSGSQRFCHYAMHSLTRQSGAWQPGQVTCERQAQGTTWCTGLLANSQPSGCMYTKKHHIQATDQQQIDSKLTAN